MVNIVSCRKGDGLFTGSSVHGAYETDPKILRASIERCSHENPEGSDNTTDAHQPGDHECTGRRRAQLEAGAGVVHRRKDGIQEGYEGLGENSAWIYNMVPLHCLPGLIAEIQKHSVNTGASNSPINFAATNDRDHGCVPTRWNTGRK